MWASAPGVAEHLAAMNPRSLPVAVVGLIKLSKDWRKGAVKEERAKCFLVCEEAPGLRPGPRAVKETVRLRVKKTISEWC